MIVLVAVGLIGAIAKMVTVLTRSSGDLPERLLTVAAKGLPAERGEWRQAMLTELHAVDGRGARWRFALGCSRVALLPPVAPTRRSRFESHTLILSGASVVVLSVGVGLRLRGQEYPDSTEHGAVYLAAIWTIVAAIVAALVFSAARRLRSQSPGLVLARRLGVRGGVVTGALVLAACSPGFTRPGDSDPLALTPNAWLLLVALVVPLAAGRWAAKAGGSARFGREAGWWAGVVGAGIVVVGILAATFFATHWFTHDPSTLAAYRSYWPPLPGLHQTHYRNITAFVFSANLDTAAVVGVLMLPLFSYIGGAVGGIAGRHRQSWDDHAS